MTIENKTITPSEPQKKWEQIADEASMIKAQKENAALEALVAEAAVTGKEQFDVDKMLQYYFPNDITDNETLIKSRVQSYQSDYYHSSAMTLEEWAENKERVEAQGDS
jgi:hypothetical protein